MTTIRDVARLAGVSTATVSRFLSGDVPVSEQAGRRVERAIEELGYTPNAISRALRARSSTTVALLVADIENPFLTTVIRGVESVLRDEGYALLLFNSDEDPALEAENLRAAREARPAGLIITPVAAAPDLRAYTAAGTAVVAVDRPIDRAVATIDTVLVETREAARRTVEHLHELGARRVALITGPHGTYTADQRHAGWLQALGQEERAAQDHLVRFTRFQVAGGEAATAELFARTPRPDAVLAANSLLAIGALRTLRTLGLQIGVDVRFAAFDDAPWTGLLGGSLDLVRQPALEVGRRAAELLLARMATPGGPVADGVVAAEPVVRLTGPADSSARRTGSYAGRRVSGQLSCYFLPQQRSRPLVVSMLSRPSTGLSVTSATPVSKKSRPGVTAGFSPPRAILAIASTPSWAIFNGYCCEVAPIVPFFTLLTPSQPPSTDTIVAFTPAALSASDAPAASGSFNVYTKLMSLLFDKHVSIAVLPLS